MEDSYNRLLSLWKQLWKHQTHLSRTIPAGCWCITICYYEQFSADINITIFAPKWLSVNFKLTCLLQLRRASRCLSPKVTRNVIMHPEELNVLYKLKEGLGVRWGAWLPSSCNSTQLLETCCFLWRGECITIKSLKHTHTCPHYMNRQRKQHSYNATLATLQIDGKQRKVILCSI